MMIPAPHPAHLAAEFQSSGLWREETLDQWLERSIVEAPDRPAIVSMSHSISYAKLWEAASALAAGLRLRGLRPGDVVAVQLPNCAEFIIAYLAIGFCGAIMQTVHMPYRASEIERLLNHSRACIAIVPSHIKEYPAAQVLDSLRPVLPSLREIVAVGAAVERTLAFASVAQPMGAYDRAPRANPHEPFLLLYTSGTTAAPKGVPMTYRPFLANARLSAAELGLGVASILMSAAPFTHLYGLFSLNLALAVGATIALLPTFSPQDLVEALRHIRPTALFVAPAHIAGSFAAGTLSADALASLRFVMTSGSPCPPQLAQRLQQMMPDGKVLQLWGMSEIQAGSFTRPDDSLAVRTSTTGRASPGTALRIVDSECRLLPAGDVGELQVRGCSVFAGYHDDAAATQEAFTADGWFRSGDLAAMDVHGNVSVTGRLKELINRGGVKFNPIDVETILDMHPSVQQSAVVPMPDPVFGERACCFAVLHADREFTLDVMRAWLDEHRVSKTKWPERIEIIDSMPLTATRKIIRSDLTKRLA